jgi:hypothetical protein
MYDLCMFICYLVYITQVRKDTYFGLDNWYECGNLFHIMNTLFTLLLKKALLTEARIRETIHI